MARNPKIHSKEPILNVPATILYAVVLLGLFHFLGSVFASMEFSSTIIWIGAFIPVRFADEPLSSLYTLVSYSLLHGSWGHLVNNCVWLLAFGSPIASALGGSRFFLFWMICAAAAALIHFAADVTSPIPMIGASGAVSGMMGAVARSGFSLHVDKKPVQLQGKLPTMRTALSSRSVQMFLLVYLMINIGIGLGETPASGMAGIAWQAHIGGLVAGFFLFSLFVRGR